MILPRHGVSVADDRLLIPSESNKSHALSTKQTSLLLIYISENLQTITTKNRTTARNYPDHPFSKQYIPFLKEIPTQSYRTPYTSFLLSSPLVSLLFSSDPFFSLLFFSFLFFSFLLFSPLLFTSLPFPSLIFPPSPFSSRR